MAKYKIPGVYVEDISKLPLSVAQVETAIPAFIGYTQNETCNGLNLIAQPKRIKSLDEYVEIFGKAKPAIFSTGSDTGIKIKKENNEFKLAAPLNDPFTGLKYRMYYSLQLYFANGGGPCYIVSCGKYKTDDTVSFTEMISALQAVRKEDEPTMILYTDAVSIPPADIDELYGLYAAALKQCSELMDRITLVDIYIDPAKKGDVKFNDVKEEFRNKIGNGSLSYGVAYYPWLKTILNYYIDESTILILRDATVTSDEIKDNTNLRKFPPEGSVELSRSDSETSLYHWQSSIYTMIRKEIEKFRIISPPSPAVAGVYVLVDNTRGVWKAPANVSLKYVTEPCVKINDEDQEDMNVTPTGKSVNTIRSFTGKGVLVWGARTLAGNDNEWRYISVRRFYNMVEESVKKATKPFIFEPNNNTTWIKVRSMIENYMILLWRAGALQGAKQQDAFFVRVGLGETMTRLDIEEGRMIVEMGMAVVRPAEFIILRFSHKMMEK